MSSSPSKPSKVLVVDDDHVLVRIVSARLRDEGYEVIAAENGVIGLHRVHTDQPDIIVLDVMMPEMDGWDMLRRLREPGSTIP